MDAKTERSRRNSVNRELSNLCKGYHDGLLLSQIDEVLEHYGFNAAESAIYCGREGRATAQVGEHTFLLMTWFKMEVTGRYEVVAYVS